MTALRLVGYWCESPREVLGYPDPAELVAPEWETARRARIVEYLRAGTPLATYAGVSHCRFAGCTHGRMGSSDLSDGEWLWPEGLVHYVRDHAVRLPDELVAHAARSQFVPAKPDGATYSVDRTSWLRWAAEQTPPPPAAPGACTLDEARAICEELATRNWHASIASVHRRWKLELAHDGTTVEDYTGPIDGAALRAYLFASRVSDEDALLGPERAEQIASEVATEGRMAKPFASRPDARGRTWWAVVSSTGVPLRPLDQIDLEAVSVPEPGWAAFLPGNWKVEALPAMDEPAWRFFVERWHRALTESEDAAPAAKAPAAPPADARAADARPGPPPTAPPADAPAADAPPSGGVRGWLRKLFGKP